MNCRLKRSLFVSLLIPGVTLPALGQALVVAPTDPESLFTGPNPRLNANKQVGLHIVRDLLESIHWENAEKYISERYMQHNFFVASGLAPIKRFFAARPSRPIAAKLQTKVVSSSRKAI